MDEGRGLIFNKVFAADEAQWQMRCWQWTGMVLLSRRERCRRTTDSQLQCPRYGFLVYIQPRRFEARCQHPSHHNGIEDLVFGIAEKL